MHSYRSLLGELEECVLVKLNLNEGLEFGLSLQKKKKHAENVAQKIHTDMLFDVY